MEIPRSAFKRALAEGRWPIGFWLALGSPAVAEVVAGAGYTDGLTEPESATGEPFGAVRLEQVLRECRSIPAEELGRQLLAAVTAWLPTSVSQQDDITFIIIDVL